MRRSTYFPQFVAPSAAAVLAFESLGSAEIIERTSNGVRCHRAEALREPHSSLREP